MRTDERIARMVQRRDRRGLAWLYDKYGSNLYGVAFEILRDRDQAVELVRYSIESWIQQPIISPKRMLYQLLFLVRQHALELRGTPDEGEESLVRSTSEFPVLDALFLSGRQSFLDDSETLRSELRSAFRVLRDRIESRTSIRKNV
jgi:DNA-directed RNA polymerase specialized sigma24 family protein